MKIYKVTFDCQMKDMPLIMQPHSAYVEADSEYHAVKRGWMVIESDDENLKKLNISCAAVKEVNEARSVSVFMLDGNETKTSVSE